MERPFLEPEQSFQCIFLLNQFSSLVHFHKITVFWKREQFQRTRMISKIALVMLIFWEISSCGANKCLSRSIRFSNLKMNKFYSELEQLWSWYIQFFSFSKLKMVSLKWICSQLVYWKCMYFIHNQTREMSWSLHISKKSTLSARFSLKPVLSLVKPVRFRKRNPRKQSKRISFLIILHLIKMNVNKVSKIL